MAQYPDHETSEQTIEGLKQQLAQAERMATLGELTSTTTHEFNNILTTIINYAKLGLRHPDEQTRTKSLDKILSAANRAAKITSTILGMAKNRKIGFEPTQLNDLIEDTLFLLEREMNKYRVSVEKNLNPIPEVYVDGNKIQQVLINLLVNARQAMPNGGRLIIKTSFDQENQLVDLMIRDFGTGIPVEKLPQIFERFYSTKDGADESGKGGTGLGLSTCHEIMEAHHGKIRVESKVGKGTAFILRFPIPAQPVQPLPLVVSENLIPSS